MSRLSFLFKTDLELCEECNKCEELVPGFSSEHHKSVVITEGMLNTEEVQDKMSLLSRNCPAHAIELVPHKY